MGDMDLELGMALISWLSGIPFHDIASAFAWIRMGYFFR